MRRHAAAVIDAAPTRALSIEGSGGRRCSCRSVDVTTAPPALLQLYFWAGQRRTLCHYSPIGMFEWTPKISLSTACDLWVGEKPFEAVIIDNYADDGRLPLIWLTSLTQVPRSPIRWDPQQHLIPPGLRLEVVNRDGAENGVESAPVKVLNEKTEQWNLIIREFRSYTPTDRQLLLLCCMHIWSNICVVDRCSLE